MKLKTEIKDPKNKKNWKKKDQPKSRNKLIFVESRVKDTLTKKESKKIKAKIVWCIKIEPYTTNALPHDKQKKQKS